MKLSRDDRVRDLLQQITHLEEELRKSLHEQELHFFYQIKGKKVEFEQSTEQAHRKLKSGLLRWIVTSPPRHLLSAPFIYAMVMPIALLDLSITSYQAICFPLYRIAKVKRAEYIALDHHRLAYLNSMEKLNCLYCSYINGLLAYASEIAARTEQYWCPIKHARKMFGSHARAARFLAYGDAVGYHTRLEAFRTALKEKEIEKGADSE